MADFVAVLKKTIGGLNDNTPQMREKVYQRARDTVAAKLAAMDPAPPKVVVNRQTKALEAAIEAVESSYAVNVEAEDEFSAIFAGAAIGDDKPSETESGSAPEMDADGGEPPVDMVAEPSGPSVEDKAATPETGDAEISTPSRTTGPEDLIPAEATARPDPVLAGGPKGADKTDGLAQDNVSRSGGRRVSGGLIAAVVALLVVAAAGYGVWLNRDAFASLFATDEQVASAPVSDESAMAGDNAVADETAAADEAMANEAPIVEDAPADEANAPAEPETPASGGTQIASASDEPQKFTQRLKADGSEVDPGPADGKPSIGEGTTVASATLASGDAPAAAAGEEAPAPAKPGVSDKALPVGQRAIYYEERTTVAESTADTGTTVWSLVQESPGNDLPPEPAIRAEVTIPSKNIQLRMTIRRNADPSLPASHIIEMIFLTSDGFEGGGIDNVLRIALKPSEAAPGNPLIGIPAKIADGYFLVALSSVEAERDFNLQLMQQQSWIDIPIVYTSGRRALVTMERGLPGDRVFTEAMEAWKSASSG